MLHERLDGALAVPATAARYAAEDRAEVLGQVAPGDSDRGARGKRADCMTHERGILPAEHEIPWLEVAHVQRWESHHLTGWRSAIGLVIRHEPLRHCHHRSGAAVGDREREHAAAEALREAIEGAGICTAESIDRLPVIAHDQEPRGWPQAGSDQLLLHTAEVLRFIHDHPIPRAGREPVHHGQPEHVIEIADAAVLGAGEQHFAAALDQTGAQFRCLLLAQPLTAAPLARHEVLKASARLVHQRIQRFRGLGKRRLCPRYDARDGHAPGSLIRRGEALLEQIAQAVAIDAAVRLCAAQRAQSERVGGKHVHRGRQALR